MMKKHFVVTLLTVILCTGCGDSKTNTGITAVEDSIVQPTVSIEFVGDQLNANKDITPSNVFVGDQLNANKDITPSNVSQEGDSAETETKTVPYPKPTQSEEHGPLPTPSSAPVPPEPGTILGSVPVLMDYCGRWIDQYGEKISSSDANSYLKSHPAYCQAAIEINRGLEDLETDMRNFEMEQWAGQVSIAKSDYAESYKFIDEQVVKLRKSQVYILLAANPFKSTTVQSYMDYTGFIPNLVPIYDNGAGWTDQFGDTMQETEAEQILQKYPDLQASLEKMAFYAGKLELSDEELFLEAQSIYNAWFMWQARMENGITNSTFYQNDFYDLVEKDYEPWSMNTLAEKYDQEARFYRSQAMRRCRKEAIEQFKQDANWCDECYEIYARRCGLYDDIPVPTQPNDIASKIGYCILGHPINDFVEHIEELEAQIVDQ